MAGVENAGPYNGGINDGAEKRRLWQHGNRSAGGENVRPDNARINGSDGKGRTSYLPHTSLIKSQIFISTHKPTPLPPLLILSQLHPSSTPLLHSCQLTRNRQSTLSIMWFLRWSRSCSYHRPKENFQRNISNYPLNSKSFHNHLYLAFHLKIIYNQPTVKKSFTQ